MKKQKKSMIGFLEKLQSYSVDKTLTTKCKFSILYVPEFSLQHLCFRLDSEWMFAKFVLLNGKLGVMRVVTSQ